MPGTADPAHPGKETTQAFERLDFLARLRGQDHGAFELLVRHYHRRLLGFAGSLAGERLAEDVVQEAWVSAWRALPRFEGRSALKTWLYTIVRNECSTRLRQERRVPTVNIDTESFTDGIDGWFAASFAADGHWTDAPPIWGMNTPELLLEEAQLRECLERHIAGLGELQRAVFRLRDIEQMGAEEICNILDLSASNMRVLLHRARLRLLQVIDHYQETGECRKQADAEMP